PPGRLPVVLARRRAHVLRAAPARFVLDDRAAGLVRSRRRRGRFERSSPRRVAGLRDPLRTNPRRQPAAEADRGRPAPRWERPTELPPPLERRLHAERSAA